MRIGEVQRLKEEVRRLKAANAKLLKVLGTIAGLGLLPSPEDAANRAMDIAFTAIEQTHAAIAKAKEMEDVG